MTNQINTSELQAFQNFQMRYSGHQWSKQEAQEHWSRLKRFTDEADVRLLYTFFCNKN